MGSVVAVAEQLLEFVQRAVGGGFVLAIALICGVQYAFHMYRLNQSKRLTEAMQKELDGLEGEFQSVQKDRNLTQLENHILREFVSQTELDRALDVLLRRFVPNAQDGFGALLLWQGEALRTDSSRGLSVESSRTLEVDPPLIDRIRREGYVLVEGKTLHDSRLLASLSKGDRGKVREIALVVVGEKTDPVGVLATTALYPVGAPREQQLELARRLMLSVAGNIRRARTIETQEHRLRSTTEQLELRSIADGRFETPLAMITQFVDRLASKLGLERTALYLAAQENRGASRALMRRGEPLAQGAESLWHGYEDRLAEHCLAVGEIAALDEATLRQIGIDRLMRRGLLVPLKHDGVTTGAMCFTSRDAGELSDAQVELAAWAASYLNDRIHRALQQAVAERDARQDGLTELANRRAFDARIRREIDQAQVADAECTLMLFDIDHFKTVNDRFGHQAGDEVLRQTARTLKDQVLRTRSGDRMLIARYGGEEMAVLLPGISLPGALRIGEAIREAVAAQVVKFQGQEVRVTISVGLAGFPGHARSVEDLIAAADSALYQAKQSGRNCVCTSQADAAVALGAAR